MPDNFWKQFGNTYDEANKNTGGVMDFMSKVAQNYQAPQTPAGQNVQSPQIPQAPGQPEKSYGLAGLAATPGPLVAAAAPLMAGAAGMLAVPAAAAYGIGKLVAPRWTGEAARKVKDFGAKILNRAEAVGSAALTGMGESIPGSKFAETLLPQQARDFISTVKNQHPLAAMAGQVAGTVGQMALPGAAVFKGGGLLAGAGNAALNTLPYAVGTGLDVGATTGDVGKGLLAAGASQVLGTAVPTALHALSQIPVVNNLLAKVQLAGRGIRSGDVIKNLYTRAKGLGMTRSQADTFVSNNSEGLVNNIADLIGQAPPGRAGLRAIKTANSAGFEAHANLWDSLTGKQIGPDDIAAVLKDPDLQPVISRFGQNAVEKTVNDMASELNEQGWTNARGILTDYNKAGNNFAIKRGALSPKDPRILNAGVADAFHDRIDGTADRIMEWAKQGQLGPHVPGSGIQHSTVARFKIHVSGDSQHY